MGNGNGVAKQLRVMKPDPSPSFVKGCRAILAKDHDWLEANGWQHTSQVTKASQGELSGATGGFLVPQEYTTKFLIPFAERAFIYPRATVVPMNSLEMSGPVLDAETAINFGSPFFGGIVAKWGSQAGTFALQESEPQFRQQNLTAWDLLCYAIVPNQLLQDAGPEGDAKLLDAFGKAAAWYAEYAFLRGTGVNAQMPLGMLNAPCALLVSRKTSSHIAVDDPAAMAAKLIPYSWENSVWACSPSAMADLMKITGWVPNANPTGLLQGCAGWLNARPVFPTEKLFSLGTKGDLVLFDPSMYLIGDRMQVVIDVSDQAPYSTTSVFQRNQSMFRTWLRLDGKPILPSSVTLADGNTASSVVVLN